MRMNSGKPDSLDAARDLARGVFRLARRLRVLHGEAKGGLSTLSLLASVHRLGPTTASSCGRASSKAATFAHAISRTRPTSAIIRKSEEE